MKPVTSINDHRGTRLKQAYIDLLTSEDNKYHLTITFQEGTRDPVALESLNFFIKCLNQHVYGRRYLKKGKYVKGFVAKERCDNRTLHFHILVRDPDGDLNGRRPFREAVEAVIPKIRYDTRLKDPRTGGRFRGYLIGGQGWLLQDYRNDGTSRLEQYLTKNFDDWSVSLEDRNDSIGILGFTDVQFGY